MSKNSKSKDAMVVVVVTAIVIALAVGGLFWISSQKSQDSNQMPPDGSNPSQKTEEDEPRPEDLDKSTLPKNKSLPPEVEEEIPPHKRHLEQ